MITYIQLNQDRYKLERIGSLKIKRAINQHIIFYMSAILEEGCTPVEVTEVYAESQINLVMEEKNIFSGMIQSISVRSENDLCYIEVTAVSNTFQMDRKRINRSFQNTAMKYQDILSKIISSYDGDILDKVSNGQRTEKYIMQYEETDWEFLKRLASHFHMGVLPVAASDKPQLFFGISEGTKRGKIEKYNYFITKDIKAYEQSRQNTNKQLRELDCVTFYVEMTEPMDIGDYVTYKNIHNLYVKSSELQMLHGVLKYSYELCLWGGLTQDFLYNQKIKGISLKGRVIDVIQDRVKVYLEIDQKRKRDNNLEQQKIDDGVNTAQAYEFPYTTMYTAEGHSGWYCMPEINDDLFVYFPDCREWNGVGMQSVRTRNLESDKTDRPEVKYFRTKDGKELKFAPDEIVITCCNKQEEDGTLHITYIRLNDKNGIELYSTQPIQLTSVSNIHMEAEKIHLDAKEKVLLKCKNSVVKLDNAVDIAGPEVKIN